MHDTRHDLSTALGDLWAAISRDNATIYERDTRHPADSPDGKWSHYGESTIRAARLALLTGQYHERAYRVRLPSEAIDVHECCAIEARAIALSHELAQDLARDVDVATVTRDHLATLAINLRALAKAAEKLAAQVSR